MTAGAVEIPSGIADVTARWLTEVLGAHRALPDTVVGWDTPPERARRRCLSLADRAVATLGDVKAVEVLDE